MSHDIIAEAKAAIEGLERPRARCEYEASASHAASLLAGVVGAFEAESKLRLDLEKYQTELFWLREQVDLVLNNIGCAAGYACVQAKHDGDRATMLAANVEKLLITHDKSIDKGHDADRLARWLLWRKAWTGSAGPHDEKGTPWYDCALRGDDSPRNFRGSDERGH